MFSTLFPDLNIQEKRLSYSSFISSRSVILILIYAFIRTHVITLIVHVDTIFRK